MSTVALSNATLDVKSCRFVPRAFEQQWTEFLPQPANVPSQLASFLVTFYFRSFGKVDRRLWTIRNVYAFNICKETSGCFASMFDPVAVYDHQSPETLRQRSLARALQLRSVTLDNIAFCRKEMHDGIKGDLLGLLRCEISQSCQR